MITLEQIQDKYQDYAPVPIIDIANELGLKIYETDDLKDNESGLIKKEGDNYVIYVNESHAPTRKRFTIAHEIVHFLKHKDVLDEEYVTNSKQSLSREDGQELTEEQEKIEVEANKIAAKILMPKVKFIEIWRKSKTIEEVASQFKVSIGAATIRASRLLGETII